MREHLSLVVAGAPTIDVVATDNRLEGWRAPFLKRFGRLYIVMAIDENRWGPRRSLPPFSIDDRVARSRDDLHLVQADSVETTRQPRGTICRVLGMLRLRADGGETDKGTQLGLEARPVVASIGECISQRIRSRCRGTCGNKLVRFTSPNTTWHKSRFSTKPVVALKGSNSNYSARGGHTEAE